MTTGPSIVAVTRATILSIAVPVSMSTLIQLDLPGIERPIGAFDHFNPDMRPDDEWIAPVVPIFPIDVSFGIEGNGHGSAAIVWRQYKRLPGYIYRLNGASQCRIFSLLRLAGLRRLLIPMRCCLCAVT